MTNVLMMTAAAVLSVATSPVMAREARPAEASATAAVDATTQTQATNARPVRYCVEDAVTGSRILMKTCATREEWLKRGFDPLAK